MGEQKDIHRQSNQFEDPGDHDVFCKLFADRIDRQVCVIRKQELNKKEGFSCSGCKNESNEITSA